MMWNLLDDVGTMGMMWGPWGQHWVETTETTAMGTKWGPSVGYGDDVGMTGTTWGQQGQHGDHGDNVGTTETTKSLKMP